MEDTKGVKIGDILIHRDGEKREVDGITRTEILSHGYWDGCEKFEKINNKKVKKEI